MSSGGPAPDPYVYPGTSVLLNTHEIRNQSTLTQIEADVSFLAIAELATRWLPGDYDLDHLQDFHRFIFGEIYPWAGQLRVVAIHKKTTTFCLPQHLKSFAEDVFGKLAYRDRLHGLDHDEFLRALADLWGDLNSLHPFREGNGRATRAFLSQLSRSAGYNISWTDLDADRNESASIAAHHGDLAPMREILSGRLSRLTLTHEIRTPAPRAPRH